MSKKKNKHSKQHRSIIEAQKAEMKSFEYAPVRAVSTEMKSTEGKKESDLTTHQLPIAQIKKDFTKIDYDTFNLSMQYMLHLIICLPEV